MIAFALLAHLVAGPCTVQVFLSHDCPCNVICKDELNEIAAELREAKISFTGVTDLPPKEAKEFAEKLTFDFPVDGDPKLKRIHAAHAEYSLEIGVFDAKNKLVKFYAGYDQGMVKEMAALLTKLAHRPVKMDPSKFPDLRRVGCAFEPS